MYSHLEDSDSVPLFGGSNHGAEPRGTTSSNRRRAETGTVVERIKPAETRVAAGSSIPVRIPTDTRGRYGLDQAERDVATLAFISGRELELRSAPGERDGWVIFDWSAGDALVDATDCLFDCVDAAAKELL